MNHYNTTLKTAINGIIPYLIFFTFWITYSAFILYSYLKDIEPEKFSEIFLTPSIFILLMVLIVFYFKVSLLFSRLDGILYTPSAKHYTVSGENYIKSNFLLIVGITIVSLFISFILLVSNKSNVPLSMIFFIIFNFLFIFLIRLFLKELNVWIALLICNGPLLAVLILSNLNDSFEEWINIGVLWTLIGSLIIIVIFTIVKFPKIAKKFFDFIFYTLFSEFYVADQLKKHNQNIEILYYLFENSTKNKKESLSELNDSLRKNKLLIKFLKSNGKKLFLKYYEDGEDYQKNSFFLDISIPEEFIMFINRLKKNTDEDYKTLILELEDEYFLNETSYKFRIMDSRTDVIKLRNNCNLVLSFFLMLITISFMGLSNYHSKYKMLIFLILISPIFLRLVLRGFEIGRSFYIDLTTSKYPESFLTGNDRMSLAVKSILEVVFLSSSVYLLCSLFECGWSFKIEDITKIILHAFSVSMFNISYSDEDGILLIYQLTHVIQVVISLILITIGISGYMTRIKYPVYYENILEGSKYKFIQHTLFIKREKINYSEKIFYEDVSKTILCVDVSNVTNKEKKYFIIDELEKKYKDGDIKDEEYYHFRELVLKKNAVGEHIVINTHHKD